MLQLAQPVCRIDVDQNGASLGRGVLDDQPLDAVGAPDADPVTPLDAARQEGAGRPFRGRMHIRPGQTDALMDRDERVAFGKRRRNPIETMPDRFSEERDGRWSADVGHERGQKDPDSRIRETISAK